MTPNTDSHDKYSPNSADDLMRDVGVILFFLFLKLRKK